MSTKKIINDRQRARKVYGFVQRLPDIVTLGVSSAESDAAVLSLDWKESVRFASTGSVTLPPGVVTQAIDGAANTLSNNDRILLKDQAVSSENGIYKVNTSAGTWTRTDDAIPGDTLTCGATVYVEDGTSYEGTKWVLSTKNVTLGGSQTWTVFASANDWIASGGEMKTADAVSIGANYPSLIAPDVFFYVSGTRASQGAVPGTTGSNITVFAGDVVISGSLNFTNSDGFFGDTLEISGSAKLTTGSFYFQKAGTNDYTYFIESASGVSFQSGSLYHTGSAARGYGSQALGNFATATGLFSKAQRFGQFSQASSGFEPSYLNNTASLGETQYSRLVWCGVAPTGASQLLFKGYNSSNALTQFFDLENDKTYYVRATAAVVDTQDQTDSATFVREALFYKTGGTATRVAINSTLSLPNANTYTLDIVASGSTGNTDMAIVINAVSPPFGTTGDLRGTVTVELTEIQN